MEINKKQKNTNETKSSIKSINPWGAWVAQSLSLHLQLRS